MQNPTGGLDFVRFHLVSVLDEVGRRYGLGCHQHANDIQLYLMVPSDPKEAMDTINWCQEWIVGWIWANKVKLKVPDKMEVLLMGSNLRL